MAKTALITGIAGQDGAYLARLLVDKGYRVVGGMRRTSSSNTWRLEELNVAREVELVDLDVAEITNVMRVIERVRPDEIYNLAGQSFVAVSFESPIYTADINALGPARILEAIREVDPKVRFYQASTSEMYGKVQETPQSERTPFHPRNPYAVAKLYAHWLTVNYRESYGLHATAGILFNHESPLRGRNFVTRKITSDLARLKHGKLDAVRLGNLSARRDWGFAGDFVEGIWLMVQAPEPQDYVLATGESSSVRRFVELAAPCFGFDIEWHGTDLDEVGVDRKSGRTIIRTDPKFRRPAEVDTLVGFPQKAERELGWRSRIRIDELARMMADADDRRVRDGMILL